MSKRGKPDWADHDWPQIVQNQDGNWFGVRAGWVMSIGNQFKGDELWLLREDGEFLAHVEPSANWRNSLEQRPSMKAEFLIAHCGHTGKSEEHICWWKPDSRGYTICVDKAGRYSEEKARSICDGSACLAVPVSAAVALARTTPYYRLSNGTLDKLYDGGPHRPVENTRKAWGDLKLAAVVTGRYAKPTPITPSKARAIYLGGKHGQQ